MTAIRPRNLCIAFLVLFLSSLIISGCGSGSASPEPQPQPVPPPAINSFTASSSSVAPGASITLSWNLSSATSMSATDGTTTVATGPLPQGGTNPIQLNRTTTFTLTASNSAGQAQSSLTVTVSPNPPTVQLSANPNPVPAGQFTNLSWTTTNAISITFEPEIEIEDVDHLPLQNPGGISLSFQQTTTYKATVTGADNQIATASITMVVTQPPPALTFTASSQSVLLGTSATLNWSTQDAASLRVTDDAGNVVVSAPPDPLATGSKQTPALNATTTFTAVAVGSDGQQTEAAVSVSVASLVANPNPVSAGQITNLSWNFPGAGQVVIDNCNLLNASTCAFAGASGTVPTQALNSTVTFTATASGGTPPSASVVVTVAGLSQIKHIIFFMQENRSFDSYFGLLGEYRAKRVPGAGPKDIDGLDPNNLPLLPDLQSPPHLIRPFHYRTVCTENLSPFWNESHAAAHLKNGTYLMDGFMKVTRSVPHEFDPWGHRAMGYYDENDLPYYYELATQFATSDRWFSPVMTNTVPNRMYLFTGTSFGHVKSDNPPKPATGWTQKTIFQLLDENNIKWKYYQPPGYSSIFLADFDYWNHKDANGNLDVQGRSRTLDEWFSILSSPNADQLLPPVVFIERGGNAVAEGAPLLDEHPLNNVQVGAKYTKKIIDALMKSTAWKSSVFIWTFDEGGGLYDHVPPVPMPKPDAIEPILRPGDAVDQFDKTGFRVPLIVISPWVKPHFVSHEPRDFTAILNFIEERFGLPALTDRDKAQKSMTEFFDFTNPNPPLMTPPPLPEQPAENDFYNWHDPDAGVCSFRLETDPTQP